MGQKIWFVALACVSTLAGFAASDASAYRTVAEEGTPVPGKAGCVITGGFGDDVSVEGDRIAFLAEYDCSGVSSGQGLFLEDGPGNLIRILDTDDMIGGEAIEEFSMQFMTGLSGNRLGFAVNEEEIAYVADLSTNPITVNRLIGVGDPLPNGEIVDSVSSPAVAGAATAFVSGWESVKGIVFSDGAGDTLPVSPAASIPGAPGYVVTGADSDLGIQAAGATGGAMFAAEVFLCPVAEYDPMSGCVGDTVEAVVTVQDGVISNRADMLSTINPSSGELFAELDEPGLYDGAIAFAGDFEVSGEEKEGVYTDCSGTLEKVVDALDPVPGFPTYEFGPFAIQVGFNRNLTTVAEEIVDTTDPMSPEHEMILSAHPDGTLTDCANTMNSTSPSTGKLFADFNDAAVEGTTIVFQGSDVDGFTGLYTGACGTLPATGCATPPETPMSVTRATLWRNGSKPGRVVYEGVVADLDPMAGLDFTVTDGGTLNQSASVGPADCSVQRSGVVKCVYKDPSIKKKKVKATFKPTGNAGEYAFKLDMNKLSIPGPQTGPATLSIMETGGATFVGSNANCQVFTKKMVCSD